jgi:hypothetical protein
MDCRPEAGKWQKSAKSALWKTLNSWRPARAIRASVRQNKRFAKCQDPIFVAPAPPPA